MSRNQGHSVKLERSSVLTSRTDGRAVIPLSGAFQSQVKERPGVRFRQTSISIRSPLSGAFRSLVKERPGARIRQISTSEKPPTQGVAVKKDFESFL